MGMGMGMGMGKKVSRRSQAHVVTRQLHASVESEAARPLSLLLPIYTTKLGARVKSA